MEGSNRFPDRRRIPTCEARHGDFGQPRFRRLDGIAHGMIAFCRRRCSFPQFVGTADLLLLALRRRVLATLHLVALLYQLLKKNFKVLRLLCKDGVDDSAQAVTVASSRRVNDALLPFPIRLVLDGGELMFQADQIAQPLYCKGGKPEIFELPGPIQGSGIINNVVVNRNCAM